MEGRWPGREARVGGSERESSGATDPSHREERVRSR